MPEKLTKAARSALMGRVRQRDTAPELRLRRLLHGLGYRFSLQDRNLPGRPDIKFSKRRAAIFVHGCFWHGHQNCPRGSRPASNREFWDNKLDRNVERDQIAEKQLVDLGWRVLIVWECELRDEVALKDRLRAFLGPPRTSKRD